jgi:hypothetical protein
MKSVALDQEASQFVIFPYVVRVVKLRKMGLGLVQDII